MTQPTPKPKLSPNTELDRTELWMQLTNAISLRSNQDQVLWSIFGTFWATNAILLVALFTGGTFPTEPVVGVIVGAVGMLLSFIWHALQNRVLGYLTRHEELMAKIETKLGFNPEYAVSAELNRHVYAKYIGGGMRARIMMKACSITGMLAWFWVFVIFVLRLTKLGF